MTFLIKLITIFLGSGFMSLFAFWLAKEISSLPGLILDCEKNKELKIKKKTKVSSLSGFYEIFLPEGEKIKLLSTHKGMKVIN